MRVALIFDHKVRPDTTGIYCRRALGQLVEVEHFLPTEIGRIPRQGFDLYFNIDDGLEYYLPADLHPCAWWAIDTHLNYDYCLQRARDFVFTAQRNAANRFRTDGLPDTCWLPLGCDPEFHRKHEVAKELDVCFVGHLFEGPRADLVHLIQRNYPNSFVGQKFFDEMARTYSASRAVFNRSIRDDVNMRVFEALACGSLLVTNDLSENGQDELARDGVHLATYRDPEELLDKLRFYLGREDLRERVAAAGRELALDRHTYRHRMAAALEHIGQNLKSASVAGAVAPPVTDDRGAEGNDPILKEIPEDARRILMIGDHISALADMIRARCKEARVEVVADREATGIPAIVRRVIEGAPDAGYDAIVALGLLEDLPTPRLWLRRLRDWLSPGGMLLATFVNLRHHSVIRSLIEGNWPNRNGARPGTQFTRREIEKFFYRAGWEPMLCSALPNAELEAIRNQGRPGEVNVGALNIAGLDPAEAEEFYATQYVVRAVPAARSERGLTSIVILAHNELACTRMCVESIAALTDEPYELIFVDNASTDGTAEYLRSVPGAKVVTNSENRGFPAGCNQGIREAKGQFVLLLNNDTIVTTGWLDRLLRVLESDPSVGLVGPSSNNVSGEQQVQVRYDHLAGLDGFAWEWGKSNQGQCIDTDRLVGFCLLIRREVIDKVGLLDERFGIGCFEDDDYCRRTRQAGFRVVHACDAFVHHFGGRTFAGSGIDFAALMGKNQQLFIEKWQSNALVSPAPSMHSSAQARQEYTCRAESGALRLLHKEVELSLCMIVRNNAGTIRACLESIKPWVDELIVVDTGSTDETPQIAAELGARIFPFPWCDDFSAARNESLRKARGRWIFWMDSDDTISPECGRGLREIIAGAKPETLGFVVDVHCPGAGEHAEEVTIVSHVKLFPNRPDLRFEHRIHEQILPSILRAGGMVQHTDLYVVHSGYDHSPEGQVNKLERDLRILHQELREQPDHPFTLFNLGMTYTDAHRYQEALGFLERCVEHSGEQDSHIRKAFAYIVTCRQGLEQFDQAWASCEEGLRRFPLDAELRFRRAILLHQQNRPDEAVHAYQDLLSRHEESHFRSVVNGVQGYLARHNLALVFQDFGDWPHAEEQWRLVLEEKPEYKVGWRGLGDALLGQRKIVEASQLAEQLLKDRSLRLEGLLLRGQVAATKGDVATARKNWESIVAENPLDRQLLETIARLLFESAGPAAAQTALEELAVRFPDDPTVHHNLGAAYLDVDRPDRAVAAFRTSLRHRAASPATWTRLADALDMLGQRAEATEAREEAARWGSRDAVRSIGSISPTMVATEANSCASPTTESRVREAYVQKFGHRTLELQFSARGEVDRAIRHDLWERDAYGLQAVDRTPAVVVDIGAHIGAFSLLAAELWPAARVIACEPDQDNLSILRENLAGRRGVEIVTAAVVANDVNEVEFHAVSDKLRFNSGGGSCVRPENGSVKSRVPAIGVVKLWKTKAIGRCDLLKLDCEGSEAAIIRALSENGLLSDIQLIVGEWHAVDDQPAAVDGVCVELRKVLQPTHTLKFRQPIRGREGHFSASLHAPTND